MFPELCPCCGPPAQSRRLRPAVQSAQRARRSPDGGPALCSAAPSSRRAGPGGTDLAARPRIPSSLRLGSGTALAPSRLSRGGQRAANGPHLEPPPRPDLRSSSSAASSLAPSDLRWSVQSGPRFRGEGDSDGSGSRKTRRTRGSFCGACPG
ncbi:MutS protein4 [Manis javanica]|nr:MutS protein4 [Manis javanica]